MAADRGRRAGDPHGEEAGAGDSRSASRCPTTPTCCPSRSAASRPRASTTPASTRTCRSRRAAATAARIRTWCTSSCRRWSENRDPYPERRAVGQLDLRRHLRARVGAEGRRDRQAAGVHAVVGQTADIYLEELPRWCFTPLTARGSASCAEKAKGRSTCRTLLCFRLGRHLSTSGYHGKLLRAAGEWLMTLHSSVDFVQVRLDGEACGTVCHGRGNIKEDVSGSTVGNIPGGSRA